ncbi:M23 family metallopeptidase [Rhizobium sp. L43]|uniref:peptidoglycan DD-metalloendopeptidase family protein n=1 Tax=Rhizobium sp. L43 TaxID=2035452 RepID=UPI0015CF295C|nr:M23 family metallopeptidase [Rhizobium sp. L43]
MPENLIIRGLTEQDAKLYAKLYRDIGADTKIVTMDGAYAVIVTYPSDWTEPEWEGGGEEEQPEVAEQPIETAANGMPSDPAQTQVPFASFSGSYSQFYWPTITAAANALVVSQRTTGGQIIGREGRRFLADRSNGKRYHVGVDLFCSDGEEVVACANGKVVAFFKFYKTSTGEQSYALLIDHGDLVINYGEVKADSPTRYGWSIGDNVTAGQKIARVSSTNMIHFEAYRAGTTANSRWMQNEPNPPASLRDPTQFLVKLAVSGKRLTPGGVSTQHEIAFTDPLPGSASWHKRFSGQRWRYDSRGVYTDAGGAEPLRSPGEPVTCREILRIYGGDIFTYASKHKVNPALIIMTIATESAFAMEDGFTGPRTFRWEAHVENNDVAPPFSGSYSAGPMQCLATTVRYMLREYRTKFDLGAYDESVASAISTKPNPPLATHPLYDAPASIELGTAEIRMRWATTRDDPILVAAAYNAGGIYESTHSPWGMRAYDNHLNRAAAWYGDACAVLAEIGVI